MTLDPGQANSFCIASIYGNKYRFETDCVDPHDGWDLDVDDWCPVLKSVSDCTYSTPFQLMQALTTEIPRLKPSPSRYHFPRKNSQTHRH